MKQKPTDLKLICTLIIIWAIPSFAVGSILLIELILANRFFSDTNYVLTGLSAVSTSAFFFITSLGLLFLKRWAYKIIIPLSLIYLIILIPVSVILNFTYNTFNFRIIQSIVFSVVLNIIILTFFTRKRIKRLYLK